MIHRVRHSLSIALKGFCMGMADVVPGVSGGTMAYILGIYEQLLAAINSFDVTLLKSVFLRGKFKALFSHPHWGFLLPLVVGVLSAVVFFTKIVSLPHLISNYPEHVYGLFFGLVLGSVFILLGDTKDLGFREGALMALGMAAGLFVVTMVPVSMPSTPLIMFISGAIAISAMLLPGVSGAFLLLVLGQYAAVLQAVSEFNLSILLPLMLGMGCGLIIFSRLIGWLLAHFHLASMMVINGILIGSLWRLWPYQERVTEIIGHKPMVVSMSPVWPVWVPSTDIAVFGLMVTGMVVVMMISRFAPQE